MTRDDRFYAFIVARTSRSRASIRRISVHRFGLIGIIKGAYELLRMENVPTIPEAESSFANEPAPRPPFNAEYALYLLLQKAERDDVIGDLIEDYGRVLERFNKRRADIWFYKQVFGSVLPLLRRQILRIGALVWLGRILRRLIS